MLFSSVVFSISLMGCKSKQASDGRPTVLRYAYSPNAEQMQGGGLRKELMRKYLEKQLHMPVEVVLVQGYAPTIEAMRAQKIDVAGFGALAYIIAAKDAGAEAIAAYGNADGSIGGYRSVIAVPKNSPIHNVEELKSHAKDLVFAFSDPASTSGNLYPRVGLLSMGINPERDFKKVIFAGSHPETILSVKSGKVDVGAFGANFPKRIIDKHQMAADDIRVIWTSDLIPNTCYAVRKDLPDQLKKDIQAAILAIPTRDPELWVNLSSLHKDLSSGTQYVSVNDASYDGLRRYAAQVKDFNFVEEK
jgi:phosphonate transport system substrate-binding protein